jgi:hypothetical protein
VPTTRMGTSGAPSFSALPSNVAPGRTPSCATVLAPSATSSAAAGTRPVSIDAAKVPLTGV